MARTSDDISKKIAALNETLAKYEEELKAAEAREAEEMRKYRAMEASAIGEMLMTALNAEWNQISLDDFRDWLETSSSDLANLLVTEPVDVNVAKRRFASKKTRRKAAPKRQPEPAEVEQPPSAEPQPSYDLSDQQQLF